MAADQEVHPDAIRRAFVIIEKIGEGTFGDVFKAMKRELHEEIQRYEDEDVRTAALKLASK